MPATRHPTRLALLASTLLAATACLAPPAHSSDEPKTEALLADTTRVEIVVPIAGDRTWRDVEPYTIDAPAEIARLRDTLELRPTGRAAGWDWPQRIRWVLEDDRVVEMAVGVYPDLLGVRRPDDTSRDHHLTDGFLEAIRPHLERAVAHYEAHCEGEAAIAGADGHRR